MAQHRRLPPDSAAALWKIKSILLLLLLTLPFTPFTRLWQISGCVNWPSPMCCHWLLTLQKIPAGRLCMSNAITPRTAPSLQHTTSSSCIFFLIFLTAAVKVLHFNFCFQAPILAYPFFFSCSSVVFRSFFPYIRCFCGVIFNLYLFSFLKTNIILPYFMLFITDIWG